MVQRLAGSIMRDRARLAATAVAKPVVEAGVAGDPLGTERETRPTPPLQQSNCLLLKFGLLGSSSTAPRQNWKLRGLLVKLGLLGPEQTTQPVVKAFW